MANRKDDLLLHFKFNDINTTDNTVLNSVNPNSNAKVAGADLAADDIFGACLSFDGQEDNVQIADSGLIQPDPAHTLAAWVNLSAPKQGNRSCILVLGQYGGGAHHWLLNPKTTEKGELQIGSWSMPGQLTPEILLQEWTHIATTYQNGTLTLYVNGLPIGESRTTFNITEKKLTLAAKLSLSGSEENLKGKMAHLRLYRRALTAEEIKEDMLADKMALPAYRDAHPIAFSLYDENENYALYIDDDPKDKYPLILELRNTSDRAIQFGNKGDQASAENHHFRLVFRAGTLSEKTLAKLIETKTTQGKQAILGDTDMWDIFSTGEDKMNGTTSLYFLLKDKGKPFVPTQQFKIPLHYINAQPGAGARGTRIELRLNQLTYIDDTGNVSITGSRVQHLQIINRLGSRRTPLHVSFVGSNRILNDGFSFSDLSLQLMNVLRSEAFDTKVTLTPKTEFLITFDVEETNSKKEVAPWSLCKESEIDNIRIYVVKTNIKQVPVTRGGKTVNIEIANVVYKVTGEPEEDTVLWDVTKPDRKQGESPVWRLSPKTDLVLKRDDYIQIYIYNIKTSLASGLTNLYLDYKNIPGFWGGQIVCSIEKAPLLFRPGENNGQLERRVGIDTPTPKNVLDVKGSAVIGRNYAGVKRAPDGTDLLVEGNVGIGTTTSEAKLSVVGGVHIGGTSNPGTNNLMIEGNLQFKALQSSSDIHIGRAFLPGRPHHDPESANSSLALGIYDGGWAGISIRNERSKNGTHNNQYLTFSTHLGGGHQGERMRIASDGNVGIGTTSPGAKLCVIGGVNIGGESNPGANNLFVAGKIGIGTAEPGARLSINGGLHVGGDSDPGDKNLLVDGSIKGALIASEIASFEQICLGGGMSTMIGSSPGHLLIDLATNDKTHPSLTVLGSISEKLEIIHVTTSTDWNRDSNHPIQQYFKAKLTGQPPGTLIRVLTDLVEWSGHYWEGWVTANGQIRMTFHPHDQGNAIIVGTGIVVNADR